MNEAVLLKLKVIVERAVRPVQATLSVKKKMREELLAHATGVFEDELPRIGNETEALIQTEERLGNPSELAQKLQESVPKRDRIALLIEQLIQPRAGESLWRRAVRYGATLFIVDTILSIVLLLLVFPLIGKSSQMGMGLQVLLLLSVAFGMLMIIGTLLTGWLGRALFSTSPPKPIQAIMAAVLSCSLPMLVPLFLPMAMNPFDPDNRVLTWPSLWGTLPAMLGAPLLLVGMAKLFADERRYCEEWASLELN